MNGRRTVLLLLLVLAALPGQAQIHYWDEPRILVPSGVRFPTAVSGGGRLAVFWQEFDTAANGSGQTWLSMSSTRDASSWEEHRRFAGPFPYRERETPIYSAISDPSGTFLVAISSSENTVTILSSSDGGSSFHRISTVRSDNVLVAPKLSRTSSGGLLLFVTREREEFLSTYYCLSADGSRWSELTPLLPRTDLPITVLPDHVSYRGREYVVYQSLIAGAGGGTSRYQLFLKISADGGRSWAEEIPLAFPERVEGRVEAQDLFSNQRAFLCPLSTGLGLAWERSHAAGPPQVYFAELDETGNYIGEPARVTAGDYSARWPRIVEHRGSVYLVWFDDRKGEDHVFIAYREDGRWEERAQRDISRLPGSSLFAQPVQAGDLLYIFWENQREQGSRLVWLEPDQRVAAPVLQPLDFDPGRPSRQSRVQVRWNMPPDPSGISGFAWSWSRDPEAGVPEAATTSLQQRATLEATEDGTWYFKVAAQDYAGNWSAPATITFHRDRQPPAPPAVQAPPVGPDGFNRSNTFEIRWAPPPGERVAGYTYQLRLLRSNPRALVESVPPVPPLPPRVMTSRTAVGYSNQDNGLWAFSVAAVDLAGNVSEPATLLLKLNRYIPVTYLSAVDLRRDIMGNVDIAITGRGFSEGGEVGQVFLDRDGLPPYDYILERTAGAFRVKNDRKIDELRLPDVEAGSYRLGVIHPTRGRALARDLVTLERRGTVKFGDYTVRYAPAWLRARGAPLLIPFGEILVWLIAAFLGLLILAALRKLVALLRESRLLKVELIGILNGDIPRKELRMREIRRKGVGLRFKFTLLTMSLVVLIVSMVSVPLGYYMISRQRHSLAEGLLEKSRVMLGSLSSGAEIYLPLKGYIDVEDLIGQISVIEEARFATITGPGAAEPGDYEYIWATNDPDIQTRAAGEYRRERRAVVRVRDAVSPVIDELARSVNERARERVAQLSREQEALNARALRLAVSTDEESRRELQALQERADELLRKIGDELQKIGDETSGSVPAFDGEALADEYIFYKPIIYRERGADVFYHGLVRLGVSTGKIRGEIASSRRELITRTGYIALVAAIMGLIGAFIMAAITITPIRKLADGVAVIRDTEDKEALKEHHIDIRTRDEIGLLAETVNQMTQGLVRAAVASKELIIGKEVQKMFIPLEADAAGRKGNTGGFQDGQVEIYGFYEGAKGVSGDYFDYIRLDDRHIAFIKCDVAGKGIPAALIMVEVATIFATHFRGWTLKSPGLKIESLVYRINDMLEERGFKGRFAALTLGILDSRTGDCAICNAGDNSLRLYSRAAGGMIEQKLPQAPAAGVFPSSLVEMQSGFKQVSRRLEPGDTLFLYTDGLEEAKRRFRNEAFQVVSCQEPGLQDNESHGDTHSRGADSEELGKERVDGVLNAVHDRGRYTLVRPHGPIPGERLTFDFTSCGNTVREAVLALAAVEKVFRLIPAPHMKGGERVAVDSQIDDFLKKHFEQYDSFFSYPLEAPAGGPESTRAFTRLVEDEQYDDLTILAIRKK